MNEQPENQTVTGTKTQPTRPHCGYGSCDGEPGHAGDHRCRCGRLVDVEVTEKECAWHQDRRGVPVIVDRAKPSTLLAEFHRVFEVADRATPGIPPPKIVDLRLKLLMEEFEEYVEATDNDDLIEVADALADIVYIAFGTARCYGIDLDAVLAEVHRTNMAKAPGGVVKRREDGKVLKPDGWTPPDIAGVLGVEAGDQ